MEEAKAIMKQRAKELNQIKKEAQRGGRAKGFAGEQSYDCSGTNLLVCSGEWKSNLNDLFVTQMD